MTIALVRQVTDALAEFSSRSRLYELSIGEGDTGPAAGSLLVEAFAASDAVQEIGYRDVIVLSTSDRVDLDALLGQPAQLSISLADGSRSQFGGEISEVAMLGSDGGLARYRLRILPWIWRLGQVRNSRVWQDKSVIEIVDAVFEPTSRWRAGAGAAKPVPSWPTPCRAATAASTAKPISPSCNGCWPRKAWAGAANRTDGAGIVLFADSTWQGAVPEDASSAQAGAVRFHGAAFGRVERYGAIAQGAAPPARLARPPCSAPTTRPSRSSPAARPPTSARAANCRCWNPTTCPASTPMPTASRRSAMPTCRCSARKRAPPCGMAARRCAPCAPAPG
jgi:type VI secretion system secreted protein VgrG